MSNLRLSRAGRVLLVFRINPKVMPEYLAKRLPMQGPSEKIHDGQGRELFNKAYTKINLPSLYELGYVLEDIYAVKKPNLKADGEKWLYVYTWFEVSNQVRPSHNRVFYNEILSALTGVTWNFCRGYSNPSDVLSLNFIGKLDTHPAKETIDFTSARHLKVVPSARPVAKAA